SADLSDVASGVSDDKAKSENGAARNPGAISDRARTDSVPGAPGVLGVEQWIERETKLSEAGASQLADYFAATFRSLGVIPSQRKLVLERFFDESGGMQLVIH